MKARQDQLHFNLFSKDRRRSEKDSTGEGENGVQQTCVTYDVHSWQEPELEAATLVVHHKETSPTFQQTT